VVVVHLLEQRHCWRRQRRAALDAEIGRAEGDDDEEDAEHERECANPPGQNHGPGERCQDRQDGKGNRRDFPGLEMRLDVEPKVVPSPLFRTAEAGVEWAVAQKLIEMHGGEIVERCDANGRKTVLIFLPLYV